MIRRENVLLSFLPPEGRQPHAEHAVGACHHMKSPGSNVHLSLQGKRQWPDAFIEEGMQGRMDNTHLFWRSLHAAGGR